LVPEVLGGHGLAELTPVRSPAPALTAGDLSRYSIYAHCPSYLPVVVGLLGKFVLRASQ